MMADAVYKLSNPIFKSLTGENIDMVLLNYGGIRSSISIGNINKKTAYNIMPFENDVVVTKLSGKDIFLMIKYLIITKQAHPISNAQIILNNNYELISAKVNNKLIRNTEYYNVATSNFLLNGGDKMDFFSNSIKNTKLNYKIRDLLIDYFISIDTLNLTNDKRFYIKR
jgi:5'-nucleotidase